MTIRLATAAACMLLACSALGQTTVREVVYGGIGAIGGQIIPLYDKGYLVYLHHPSDRLQVFRPDTQLAYDIQPACPTSGPCSPGSNAVTSNGVVALGYGYTSDAGIRVGGIRILDPQGKSLRFIETDGYIPQSLAFDKDDNLWTLGWQRDAVLRDYESKQEYNLIRKYSQDGKLLGSYMPRHAMWPGKKSGPGSTGRGFWSMMAAKDRIAALVHESHADNEPELLEWDLNGNMLTRTVLPRRLYGGKAYTASGRLYARHRSTGTGHELKVLDTAIGTWTTVADNLPAELRSNGLLLGANGDELVYQFGPGNLRLMYAKPGLR
jgi:hypothetical protein